MSADALISYYPSVHAKAPTQAITVKDFVGFIRSEVHAAAVAAVRAAATHDDKMAAKSRFLPAVQLSGCVTEGRRKQAIQEGRFNHSGIMQLDVDDDDLNGNSPEEARKILGADPHVMSAFITPSGEGVKALFRIKACVTEEEHKRTFSAVERYISDAYGMKLDPATKDPGRLCYLSADDGCTWHPFAEEFIPPVEAEPEPRPASKAARSKGFPAPPEHGIHVWLMQASWHCRLHERMTEADTITKLEGFNGSLRRLFQENEVRDAVAKVYSTPLHSPVFDIPEQTAGKLDLTKFSRTDLGNAERVHAYAGPNFRYVTESGQWLLWNGQRWFPDTNGGMVRLFVSVMKQTGTQAFNLDPEAAKVLTKHALQSMDTAKVMAGLQMLRSILGVSVSVNDLDANPWMIGTPDGMIDLKTGTPIRPDRSQLITKSIGTRYDATATCPAWDRFLRTVTGGDNELESYFQVAVGYTLTGSNREQCLFFLHGMGDNGKGVLLETASGLLGDYSQTAPESLFMKGRNQSATNDIARLAGCRIAIAAELEEGSSFAESRIKSLTGNDTVTARFLFKEHFDFRPTHHFWISGNHKPNIRGSDLGIWRRIRLIPFTVIISESEKDKDLGEKLAEELPGILNWALAGCIRWQREGLRTPQCVTRATEDYRAEEDVVGQFLEDCVRKDRDERFPMSSLYQAYQAWAESEGIQHPFTARVLNRKLEERGLQRVKSGNGRFWQGITTI